MGTVQRFNAGDYLFRQGDPSDHVLRIQRGEVEVLREVGAASVLLGVVYEGEWLGEMGAVERRTRSASARAAAGGEAERLTTAEFLDRVSRDPELARAVIFRLSIRLHHIEDKVAGDLAPLMRGDFPDRAHASDDALVPLGATILLSADSEPLRKRIGESAIRISKFPYAVGRALGRHERAPTAQADLTIEDSEPFRLSRYHFAIERGGRGLVVSDHGSTLGTVVNGQAIGQHFMRDSAPLHRGDNHVVAGGAGSPYQFKITI